MTRITGFAALNPQNFRPSRASPDSSSWRIGVPVRTALFSGRHLTVSGKLQQTFAADGIHSLFARPGVISDSWMSAGTLHALAARTTGTETKPPLEKTTFGFSFLSSFFCFKVAFYDAEWIGKVFRIEVAAQLSG